MPEPLNPVQVESIIREAAKRISDGVKVVSERYAKLLTSQHVLDVEVAKAYLEAGGPAHERKYKAELATVQERSDRDDADVAYRYAEKQWRALTAELDAYRSIGASVRQAYSTAGVA